MVRSDAASCALSLLLFSQVASPRSRWSTYSRWERPSRFGKMAPDKQLIRYIEVLK